MGNTVTHKFQPTVAEQPGYGSASGGVGPAEWNAEHAFAGGADGQVLVRDSTQTDGARWSGTLTAHGVVLGQGASPLTALTVLATGSLLVGQSGADPAALAIAPAGQVLVSGATPAWSANPTISTSVTTPLVIGGTGTTSPLTLRSTSGIGAAGADIVFQVGNNGATEAMRILNSGSVFIGSTGLINNVGPNEALHIDSTTGETGIAGSMGPNPGNTTTEWVVMGAGYSSTGVLRQTGALQFKQGSATEGSQYSLIGIHGNDYGGVGIIQHLWMSGRNGTTYNNQNVSVNPGNPAGWLFFNSMVSIGAPQGYDSTLGLVVSASQYTTGITSALNSAAINVYSYKASNNGAANNFFGYYVTDTGSPTNAYGLYADITSGTNRYGVYVNNGLSFFNGNVGIGGNASSPSYLLHTSGSVAGDFASKIENISATGYGLVLTTAANDSTRETLRVTANGGTRTDFLVRSDGNVGIGTTSPVTKLDVGGPINILNANSLTFGGTIGVSITGNASNGTLSFYTNVTAMTVLAGGNVGIGTTSPGAVLHVGPTGSAAGQVYVKSAAAATIGLVVDTATSPTANIQEWRIAGAAATALIGPAGGLVMGAATGGDKGAGTVNVATNIYLNGTAYTNPDYVLERWATGAVVQFADRPGAAEYRGLRPLSDVAEFLRQHWTLPFLYAARQRGGVGLFDGGDAILASVEEAYLYLIEQERTIHDLRGEIAALKGVDGCR